ncbi:hypothetical protein PILCRDRAFT_827681 [Piloderma croceum F 1598]|uniref:Uncharacterized protein n=1 Tax=Piloderma croceum (strain F 1598) TaxID=765440 RepID=A0A0C3BCC4_PILCF|nr:hypothetical protein PILCRDRAFT_827681 [Piloderma croceum F 1598]
MGNCSQRTCRRPAAIPYDTVVKYIDLIRCLKPTIALQEASYHSDPPESLTVSTHEFLKVCLAISSASWLYIQSGDFPPAVCLGNKNTLVDTKGSHCRDSGIFGKSLWHESH